MIYKVVDTPRLVVSGLLSIYMETVQEWTKGDNMAKVTIKIKAFESSIIDSATKKIVETAKAESAKIIGPIPMPTRRERFTILRSVHVNKKSREQFEMRTHKRLIQLEKTTDKLMDKLKRLELPAGVQISVETK